MFSVLFEVQPKPEKWDDYLGNAKMLRLELEQIPEHIVRRCASSVETKQAEKIGALLATFQ